MTSYEVTKYTVEIDSTAIRWKLEGKSYYPAGVYFEKRLYTLYALGVF